MEALRLPADEDRHGDLFCLASSADSIALQVGPWSCGSIQYGCSALTGDCHGWQSGSLITIRMGGSPGPCRRGHLSHRRWKKHRTYGQPLPPVLLTPRQRNTKARKTTKARTRHACSVTRYSFAYFLRVFVPSCRRGCCCFSCPLPRFLHPLLERRCPA